MRKQSIESILGGISREEFLKYYQTDKPLVVHGLDQSVNELFSSPLLGSIDELLKIWPKNVGAYLEGISDEGNSTYVSCDEAKVLFNKGHGLYFDDPNEISSLITEWLMGIKEDLGLSNLTYSRSLIYAIAKGQGTATHFDQNINFVLQVSGTKKWWIAPNTHVKNPMTRHTLGIEADPELASYAINGFPAEMPENAEEFILEPGSMLFVPRGAWHKTEALSDALSLNFTYSAPTWIDLLTCAMRGRLAQEESWRETASFVNDEVLHTMAIEKFDTLISEFANDVQSWRAMNILGVTEGSNE